ncbi:MAG: hypothetical protein J7M18_06025, partial [Candidatus Eremiobacteraeota bacterium]|nr:hypothetical protein [Candidatus Eremiobacteraeota bacterium]
MARKKRKTYKDRFRLPSKKLIKKEPPPRLYTWRGGFPIWLYLVILFIITLCAYYNSFHNDFAFDDRQTIIDDPLIHAPERWRSLLNIWRPLVRLSFLLNYNMGKHAGGGIHTFWYHVFNWIFHFINVILLFFIFRKLLRNRLLFGHDTPDRLSRLSVSPGLLAFAASLIFAIHPVQTESVTYITSRSSLMCTLFLFLGFFLYQISWDVSKKFYIYIPLIIGITICYALSISSKEIGVVLPLLMLVYDLIFKDKFDSIVKRRWIFYLPFILLIAGFILYKIDSGGIWTLYSDGTHMRRTPREHFLGELGVISIYVRLLFLPVNLNLDYDFPPGGDVNAIPASWILLGALFLASALIGAFYSIKKNYVISFALAWFVINILTVTIPMVNDYLFEHHLYIVVGGFALFIIMIFDRIVIYTVANRFSLNSRI